MNRKKLSNRQQVRMAAERAVTRDEQNRRIHYAATHPVNEVLENLNTCLRGLSDEDVISSRASFGTNKVTRQKKQSLPKRLAGAFINPFTAILFCLAIVSTITDMVFPYMEIVRVRRRAVQ